MIGRLGSAPRIRRRSAVVKIAEGQSVVFDATVT
jgi:hypothetical protein